MDGTRHRQEPSETGSVIGNSRSQQATAFAFYLHVSARRKYGVQMSRQQHGFFILGAAKFADNIAQLVQMDEKSFSRKKCLHFFGALFFLKGGRGDFGEASLLRGNPIEILFQGIESFA